MAFKERPGMTVVSLPDAGREQMRQRSGKAMSAEAAAQQKGKAGKRQGPYAVPCPVCRRPAGQVCVNELGAPVTSHLVRRRSASSVRQATS
jgi:hypothetical protein